MTEAQAQFPDLRDRTRPDHRRWLRHRRGTRRRFRPAGREGRLHRYSRRAEQGACRPAFGAIGAPVAFYHADLRDVGDIKSTVAAVESDLGAIRVLVNNAAWDDRHEIDTTTEDYWDDSQAINLKQVFFVSQAAAPGMRAAGGGAIINFSSIVFMMNSPNLASYATAKAGIIGLTKSFAGRLGPENIRVNAILPGMVVTERQMELWLTEEGIAKTIERQCLKHILKAADLVGPTLFLASDCSGSITAQSIIVDGGIF